MKIVRFVAICIAVCYCLATFAQSPKIQLVQLATGFTSPVDIKHCGDDRLFIVQQNGIIRIMQKNGVVNTTPFITIDSVLSSGNEQGLLGLAFSPNYKQDGYFYVNYTFNNGTSTGVTRISRFSVSPTDSNIALPASEQVILSFNQPYTNHNGGNMMFGPDGYLYIASGDGGSAGDPQGYGLNKNTFLGKILRIHVTGQSTYTIPPTNPFVGQTNVKQEIWSYGLRNPWRCSFDRLTGDMWIADVGQQNWEEVSFEPANDTGGRNYGWKCYEGYAVYNNASCSQATNHTPPIHVYGHTGGHCSITGGYVYRGVQHNALFGRYIFTDYCSGQFWSIRRLPNGNFVNDTLQDFFNNQFTSFGEDNMGELYVCYRGGATGTGGRIYKIVDTSDCKPVAHILSPDTIVKCLQATIQLLAGESLQYEWYNSSGIISGANQPAFTAYTSGNYYAAVSRPNGTCKNFSKTVHVIIKDTTQIQTPATPPAYCVYNDTLSLYSIVSPAGGTFTSPFTTGSIFSLSSAGVGSHTIQYTYTNADGCTSSKSFTIAVSDTTPLTSNITTQNICYGNPPISLDGYVIPAGGTYSGAGVTNNMFDPTAAGLGYSTIKYTYTNNAGCTSEYSFGIDVSICVGAEEHTATANRLRLSPVPAHDYLNLCTENQIEEVKVYDIYGRLLQQLKPASGSNCYRLQTSTLHSGMYMLEALTPHGKSSGVFIKQ
ncbi:MAG: PQQ-dependent sugar dehydrogenase [Chitinophagales bacterium]|nr:PQQ-dependent sugar dehydrogenase [Chitinophagales bacterium]MDW8419315.1 PQQ-dependent sugar dehydrogenase [Chitinophagales bacterium]